MDQWDWREKKIVLKDWEKRWHIENKRLGYIVWPSVDPGKNEVVPKDPLPMK
jgi:hypothetical protein